MFPVLCIAMTGLIWGKVKKPDVSFLSSLGVYLLGPCLYFNNVMSTEVDNSVLFKEVAYFFLLTAILFLVIFIICKFLLGYSWNKIASLVTAVSFPNSGNLGVPVALLAFGEDAVIYCVVCAFIQSLMINTFCVYTISKSKYSVKRSLINVLKMPGFWAITIAMALRVLDISLPELVMAPIKMFGQASPPIMLFLLGTQLAGAKAWKKENLSFISVTLLGKYLLYPLLSVLLIPLFFPWDSLAGKMIFLCSFFPTAVAASIMVYKIAPENEFVPAATLATNIFALITVPFALTFIL